MTSPADLLEHGQLVVDGRLVVASNATLLCRVVDNDSQARCVYKPIAGERPLWDFPEGTLAAREVAAYAVSEAAGWHVVPATLLRDGPFGKGMCQLWVDHTGERLVDVVHVTDAATEVPSSWMRVLDAVDGNGEPVALVHANDPRLRQLALFDVVINNADRKAGHVLVDSAGALYGVDHGVSFHVDDKLRTVVWGWGGTSLRPAELTLLRQLRNDLAGELGERLTALLTEAEVTATRDRAASLLNRGQLPTLGNRRRPIPWPVF